MTLNKKELDDIKFLFSVLVDLMDAGHIKPSLCNNIEKIAKKYNLKKIQYDKEVKKKYGRYSKGKKRINTKI